MPLLRDDTEPEIHDTPAKPKQPQPGSPFAPPATMATSWAAGIIVSEELLL